MKTNMATIKPTKQKVRINKLSLNGTDTHLNNEQAIVLLFYFKASQSLMLSIAFHFTCVSTAPLQLMLIANQESHEAGD